MKNRKTEPNLDLARRIRAAGADIYIEEDAPQIPTNGLRIARRAVLPKAVRLISMVRRDTS